MRDFGQQSKAAPTTWHQGRRPNNCEKWERAKTPIAWGICGRGWFTLHDVSAPECPHLAGSAGLSAPNYNLEGGNWASKQP